MEIEKIKTLNALDSIDRLLMKRNKCLTYMSCSYCPYNNLCELITLLEDEINIL